MTDVINVLETMFKAALGAGDIIMRYYNDGFEMWDKADKTPVTAADLAASEYIMNILCTAFPDYGMLCEESSDERDCNGNITRLSKKRCFIVDPIDGTKSFIRHTDQFSISIALADEHEVVAGVIYAPVFRKLYYAVKGHGAYRVDVDSASEMPTPFEGVRLNVSSRIHKLIAAASDPESDPQAEKLLALNSDKIAKVIRLSGCLKGCAIADGIADIHYKFGTYTKEWDTAAEEIICIEAGAIFTDVYGDKLTANREDYTNRRGIRILNSAQSALTASQDII